MFLVRGEIGDAGGELPGADDLRGPAGAPFALRLIELHVDAQALAHGQLDRLLRNNDFSVEMPRYCVAHGFFSRWNARDYTRNGIAEPPATSAADNSPS